MIPTGHENWEWLTAHEGKIHVVPDPTADGCGPCGGVYVEVRCRGEMLYEFMPRDAFAGRTDGGVVDFLIGRLRASTFSPPSPATPPSTEDQWEYATWILSPDKQQVSIDERGESGWELCGVGPAPDVTSRTFYFKRRRRAAP